eukprot:gene16241-biopygen14315
MGTHLWGGRWAEAPSPEPRESLGTHRTVQIDNERAGLCPVRTPPNSPGVSCSASTSRLNAVGRCCEGSEGNDEARPALDCRTAELSVEQGLKNHPARGVSCARRRRVFFPDKKIPFPEQNRGCSAQNRELRE